MCNSFIILQGFDLINWMEFYEVNLHHHTSLEAKYEMFKLVTTMPMQISLQVFSEISHMFV